MTNKGWARIAVAALVAGAGFLAWRSLEPDGLPEGFAKSNGRIEAVEIDVSTKTSGRIREILVSEGDFVTAGQILARMDTDVLEAQLREARAQLAEAKHWRRGREGAGDSAGGGAGGGARRGGTAQRRVRRRAETRQPEPRFSRRTTSPRYRRWTTTEPRRRGRSPR